MSYFLAYLIIQASAIKGWVIATAVIFIAFAAISWIVWLCKWNSNSKYLSQDEKDLAKRDLKITLKLGIIALVLIMFASMTPSTRGVFKVIGLKAGHSVITSEKFSTLLVKSGDAGEAFLDRLVSEFKEDAKEAVENEVSKLTNYKDKEHDCKQRNCK